MESINMVLYVAVRAVCRFDLTDIVLLPIMVVDMIH